MEAKEKSFAKVANFPVLLAQAHEECGEMKKEVEMDQ